jgi:hypothetical protein
MKVPVKWQPKYKHPHGKEITRISIENQTTNLFKQDDWVEMQDFVCEALVNIDSYWNDFGELFKTLKSTN